MNTSKRQDSPVRQIGVPMIPKPEESEVREAMMVLETPSFVAKVSTVFGTPIIGMMSLLPEKWLDVIQRASRGAINQAFDIAVSSLGEKAETRPAITEHRLAGMMSGALGGFFGAPALLIELPISTTLILRSIADIAQCEGEDLSQPQSRLACLEVLALGANQGSGNQRRGTQSEYYATRDSLAQSVSEVTRYMATRGVLGKSAPAAAQLINKIAIRFGVPVTQKIAFQAVPVIGALSGASLNLLFTQYFQNIAKGHFSIRRMERRFGREAVYKVYQRVLLEKESSR